MAFYSIVLNESQKETFEKAVKDLNSDYVLLGKKLDRLTILNIDEIINAVTKFNLSKQKIKTKKVEHMQMCFDCQNIVTKLQSLRATIQALEVKPESNLTPVNDDNETSNDNEDEDEKGASNA